MMKFHILVLLVVFAVSPVFASESVKVHVEKKDGEILRIQRVISAKTDVGVRVHGRVTANRAQYLPAGHVDIATYSADGTLIAQTTADVRPRSLSRQVKRKGGVRFSGEVVGNMPPGSTVKLAYHRVGSGEESPLGHSEQ